MPETVWRTKVKERELEREREQAQGHSCLGSCRVEHLFACESPKCKSCNPQRGKRTKNLLQTTRAAARGLVIAAKFADIGLKVEDSVASHVVVPPLRASYALGRTGPAVRSLGTRA